MSQLRSQIHESDGDGKALPPTPPEENQESIGEMATTTSPTGAENDRPYTTRVDSQSRVKRRDINERVSETVASLDTKDDIESQLEWALGKIRETEERLDDTVAALASLHSTDSFRQGDDRIARARDELRHDIRIWSRNFHHTSKKTVLKSLKDNLFAQVDEAPFRVVTPYWRQYLSETNERGPSLLVQAYVWNELLQEVFDQLVWIGGPCHGLGEKCSSYNAFQDLRKIAYSPHMEPTRLRDYYHWRAQTTRVLANSPKLHRDCIELRIAAITKKISSVLKPYSEKKDIFGDNENNKKANNLASIVRSAVALDLTFWQQKAVFLFDHTYERFQSGKPPVFDPRGMTTDLTSEQEEMLKQKKVTVNLVSAPALHKIGTSAGDNYDDAVVLCKGVVDCLVTWT